MMRGCKSVSPVADEELFPTFDRLGEVNPYYIRGRTFQNS